MTSSHRRQHCGIPAIVQALWPRPHSRRPDHRACCSITALSQALWPPLRPVVRVGCCEHARRLHMAEIDSLIRRSFPEEHGAVGSEDSEDIVNVLCGFHDADICSWLFCSLEGRPGLVCVALVAEYTDALFVSSLCVDPALRGRGLGSHLMKSISALAAARGLGLVTGSVSGDAPHLLRLYGRLGGVARPAAPMSAGAERAHVRLDAPSGPATCDGVRAPLPLSPVQR